MREFFSTLFGTHSGLIPICIKSKDAFTTEWFSWPEGLDEIVSYCESHAQDDVYFSPQLYGDRRRTKENVIATPCIWADSDGAPPSIYKVKPTVVVESSPEKYHLYWVLKDEVEPSWAETASRMIYINHRAEGCDNGWALSKLLRVPNTRNNKYDSVKVELIEYNQPISVAKFEKEYDAVSELPKLLRSNEIPDDLPSKQAALGALRGHMNEYINDLIIKKPDKSWSDNLWALERALFRASLTPEYVFVIARGSACNKYERDGRPEVELWQEVLKAQHEYLSEVAGKQIVLPRHGASAVPPVPTNLKLLEDEERAQIQRSFVDDYTDWASTKTKADPNYHRFSAISMLSVILGDFGHVMPAFGALKLNMWFMLLGKTTNTYKTTARNLMLRLLRAIADDDEYNYDLGSDATTEGLLEDLATRPNRTGLFYRDEAQNLIAESSGSKNYMSGFKTTLTELYDGHVRGRMRAGGKKTVPVPTSLSMYLMGVPDEMAHNLHEDDFKSGFLPRMLFYIGTPQERDRLKQARADDSFKIDPDAIRLENVLIKMRMAWEKITEPGKTVPIYFTDDAWDRLNQFSDDIIGFAESEDKDELIVPSASRMHISVMKCAAILAMTESRTEVEIHHVYTAISYAEVWYKNLLIVAASVSNTEYGRRLEEILEAIALAKDGYMRQSELYRKYRNKYKPKEFNEMIAALLDTEEIRYKIVNGVQSQYLELIDD